MPEPRNFVRLSTLCAAAAVSALISAPFAVAQDNHAATPPPPSKIGTRVHKTRDVDWESLRRDEARRGRVDLQTGALLETPPTVAAVRREDLSATHLPVLLPADKSMVEHMHLFARKDHYVAAFRDANHSVQITGTRIDQGKLEAKKARERMRAMRDAEGYLFQRTEYGVELSFTRYNVSYNISIECRKPDTDPWCSGKGFVKQMAKSLVYMGGSPAPGDVHDTDGGKTPQ